MRWIILGALASLADCALAHPLAPPPVAVAQEFCTRSLGQVQCWSAPNVSEPLSDGIADGPVFAPSPSAKPR